MSLFGSIGSAFASMGSSYLNTAYDKLMDYSFGSWAADDALDRSRALADYNAQIQRNQATWAAKEMPSLTKEGLIAAGYNPILAVNSSMGSLPSAAAPSGPMASMGNSNSKGDPLGALQQVANIKQTNAQADYLDKKTENEGWRVLTLNTQQAAGLGATVCAKLGINLHESGNRQWVLAYNTVTGELRNVANASVFGVNTTGEENNAADVKPVPAGTVEVKGNNIHQKYHFPEIHPNPLLMFH